MQNYPPQVSIKLYGFSVKGFCHSGQLSDLLRFVARNFIRFLFPSISIHRPSHLSYRQSGQSFNSESTKMSNQFDISPEQQQILLEKQERKLFLRNEYLKQKTNPFQHALGEGGAVFDPAIQRFNAMQASGYEYFKPSGKNALFGIFLMVIPMFGFGYLVHSSRQKLEQSYRRGEVAYKDRNFKLA